MGVKSKKSSIPLAFLRYRIAIVDFLSALSCAHTKVHVSYRSEIRKCCRLQLYAKNLDSKCIRKIFFAWSILYHHFTILFPLRVVWVEKWRKKTILIFIHVGFAVSLFTRVFKFQPVRFLSIAVRAFVEIHTFFWAFKHCAFGLKCHFQIKIDENSKNWLWNRFNRTGIGQQQKIVYKTFDKEAAEMNGTKAM